VVAVIAGVLIAVQTQRVSSLKSELTRTAGIATECKAAITEQSALIEAYSLDVANLKAEALALSEIVTESAKTDRIKVVERLIKDDSCEEQLRVANEILDEFYKTEE
jgi:hypothetical protein